MLKRTTDFAAALDAAKKKSVFVGLPKDKVGGKIYGDGRTIISNGAVHEYGAPQQGLPQRSFLRVPFATKRNDLNKAIAKQFEAVASGRDPDVALGRIGALATNVSKGAFTSLGYGTWTPITSETKRRKGSGQTLIDTGTLRSSITWAVRDAS
jgi:hypothetical protein